MMAISRYYVDPVIFIVLYVITIPVYYWGLALIIEGVAQNVKEHSQIKKALANRKFFVGMVINFIGWVVPYVYVFIFGRNIPFYVYIILVLYILVFFYLSLKKNHKKAVVKHKERNAYV